MTTDVDHDGLSRRADDLRAHYALGTGPLGDISTILRTTGLTVVQKRFGHRGPDGLYVRRGDRAFVLLNSTKNLPRLRFTAAHELGHHVLGHQVAVDQDVLDTRGEPQEVAANSFAASFLVPRDTLRQRVRSVDVTKEWVLDQATEFGVSYETLVYRLHNCGLLPDGAHKRDLLLAERLPVVANSLDLPQAPSGTAWPPEYVRRAVAAWTEDEISFERLAELLELQPAELSRVLESANEGDRDVEAP